MEELLNQVLLSQDSEVFNQIFDDYYPIDIALSLEALEDEEGNLLKTFTEMASDDQLVEILRSRAGVATTDYPIDFFQTYQHSFSSYAR